MRILWHLILPVVLGLFLAGKVSAQDPVPGQEIVAAASDLDEAIEGLFTYELTPAEVDEFLATMESLEAWARANPFVWNGVFSTTPLLEGTLELPYWKEVERDPLPFATTLCKVYLLFLYADPYEDTLQRFATSIEDFRGRLADPDLSDDDRELMQANLDSNLAELARVESISAQTLGLYGAFRDPLNEALDRWSGLGDLEPDPPIAFTHAGDGVRMLSSARWTSDPTRSSPTYLLTRMDAELTVVAVPWVEGAEFDESTLGMVTMGLIEGNMTTEILAHEEGEIEGRKDLRVAYRYADTDKRGMLFLTTVDGRLYMLNFLAPGDRLGLMTPIIAECLTWLEFGTYPMPLLVDRSVMGYQVHAEAPWTTGLDAPEGVDLRLKYEGIDALIDISVAETSMTPEQFQAFGEYMHASNLEEYVEPHEVGTGFGEMHGSPYGYSEVYGPRKGYPEGREQVLHIRQLYFNLGDRLLHFNIQAVEASWEQFAPLAERLIADLAFTEVIRLVTYDRSHAGYVIEASSRWLETEQLAEDIEFQLVYQGPEISMGASRTGLPDTPGIDESFMRRMRQMVTGVFEETTEPVYMSGDFDGTPFGTETFHADLAGVEEDGAPLRIVSFTAYFRMAEDVLVFSIMTREQDWPTAAVEIETLLNALTFVKVQSQ